MNIKELSPSVTYYFSIFRNEYNMSKKTSLKMAIQFVMDCIDRDIDLVSTKGEYSESTIGISPQKENKHILLIEAWEEGERNVAKLCKNVGLNPIQTKEMIKKLNLV